MVTEKLLLVLTTAAGWLFIILGNINEDEDPSILDTVMFALAHLISVASSIYILYNTIFK